jgi:hypothetical protein
MVSLAQASQPTEQQTYTKIIFQRNAFYGSEY